LVLFVENPSTVLYSHKSHGNLQRPLTFVGKFASTLLDSSHSAIYYSIENDILSSWIRTVTTMDVSVSAVSQRRQYHAKCDYA